MLMDDISLSKVMDTMGEGVFVLDASCRFVLWNRAMEEMTGWSAKEMIGKPCSHLICSVAGEGEDTSSRLESEHTLLKHADGELMVRHVECAVRTRDGESVPVLKNVRVLRDDEGQPVGVVETLTDLRPLRRFQEDLASIRHETTSIRGIGKLVGSSQKMLDVYERIQLAANSHATVLILGETGTGKELVADAIHYAGPRAARPFVKVNCSALSESLLESELFGHVKGAFTGAIKDKAGRIEAADGGTLFLDEIGDLSPLIQLKLLRVLQEQEYERVGESKPRKANVRFIAATHRDLRQRVAEGTLREDFYYRIRVFTIEVPPLLEHKEDIPLLCDAFMKRLTESTGKQIAILSHEVTHCFMDYCWPGNVRELENAIEHAFVTCEGTRIELEDLPLELRSAHRRMVECRERGTTPGEASGPLSREKVMNALVVSDWNRSEAARRLGIERTTVWRRMKQWGIQPPVAK